MSLYSQPFYTGRYGYKMCGRVYLNGDGMGKGTHLSLFFLFDAWRVRCTTRVALPPESHIKSARPVPSSSRPLGHVPPRPDKLKLQTPDNRDEYRIRLSDVHLTQRPAELSLPEGRHHIHEDRCRNHRPCVTLNANRRIRIHGRHM